MQETVQRSGDGEVTSRSSTVQHIDLDQCWDERELRQLVSCNMCYVPAYKYYTERIMCIDIQITTIG